MTRAFVLHAHPCTESYSAALHGVVTRTLAARGWQVDGCFSTRIWRRPRPASDCST